MHYQATHTLHRWHRGWDLGWDEGWNCWRACGRDYGQALLAGLFGGTVGGIVGGLFGGLESGIAAGVVAGHSDDTSSHWLLARAFPWDSLAHHDTFPMHSTNLQVPTPFNLCQLSARRNLCLGPASIRFQQLSTTNSFEHLPTSRNTFQ